MAGSAWCLLSARTSAGQDPAARQTTTAGTIAGRGANQMNAVAFRSNLTKLLIDARKLNFEVEDLDDEREVHSDSVPSPDEIRRRCMEIQKEWSPRERAKRAGSFGRQSVWTPPVVTVCEME
jgi:hypothetical protein